MNQYESAYIYTYIHIYIHIYISIYIYTNRRDWPPPETTASRSLAHMLWMTNLKACCSLLDRPNKPSNSSVLRQCFERYLIYRIEIGISNICCIAEFLESHGISWISAHIINFHRFSLIFIHFLVWSVL